MSKIFYWYHVDITYINVSKPFDHFGRHFEIFGDGMINLIEIMHFDFTYLAIKIPFIVIGTITETTWKTAHGYNSVFWKIIVESQLLMCVLQVKLYVYSDRRYFYLLCSKSITNY